MGVMRARLIALVGLYFLSVSSAWATPIKLFDCRSKKLLGEYNQLIVKIGVGTELELCNGKTVTLKEKLGEGGNTLIFSLVENPEYALRIPKNSNQTYYVSQTLKGEKVLTRYHIPHVAVVESWADAWIIVEKLEKQDFTSFREFWNSGDSIDFAEMTAALDEWVIASARFVAFGDIHANNLVYSKKQRKWLAMDWMSQHVLWDPAENTPLELSHVFPLADTIRKLMGGKDARKRPELRERLTALTLAVREENELKWMGKISCKRLLKTFW